MWSIDDLNNKAKELSSNPHILLDKMNMDEFKKWLEIDSGFDKIEELSNLLKILENHEMYEHCVVVVEKINSYGNIKTNI